MLHDQRQAWMKRAYSWFTYSGRLVVFIGFAGLVTWASKHVSAPKEMFLWALGAVGLFAAGLGILKITDDVLTFFFKPGHHIIVVYTPASLPMPHYCYDSEHIQHLTERLNALRPGLGTVLTRLEIRWGRSWVDPARLAQARYVVLDHAWPATSATSHKANEPKSRL